MYHFRESGLLYDPKYSTLKDKLHVASDIAHEQAHQWFGDWVTLDWWDNTWLNEGFATYFEYHSLAEMPDNDGTIFEVISLIFIISLKTKMN